MKRRQYRSPKKQQGITMFNVMVAVALSSALLVAALPLQIEKLQSQMVESSATQMFTLQDVAQQYRNEVGTWPGAAGAPACNIASVNADLVAQGYLAVALNTTDWGSAITTNCTANAFNVVANAPNAQRAQEAADRLPMATVAGVAVTSRAPAGGTPNNLQLLHRVAVPGRPELNQMQTDLDMNNFALNNVGSIDIRGGANFCSDGTPGCAVSVSGNRGSFITPAAGNNNLNLQINNPGAALRITDSTGTGLAPIQAQRVDTDQGLRWGNNSELTVAQGGSIELGGGGTDPANPAATGRPYIDFHFTGTAEDFNVRLQNTDPNTITLRAPGTAKAVLASDGDLKAAENIGAGIDVVAGQDVKSTVMAKGMSQAVHTMTIVRPDALIPIPTYCATMGMQPKVYVSVASVAQGPVATPIYQVRTWAQVEGASWRIKMALLTEDGSFVAPDPDYNDLMVAIKCETT